MIDLLRDAIVYGLGLFAFIVAAALAYGLLKLGYGYIFGKYR